MARSQRDACTDRLTETWILIESCKYAKMHTQQSLHYINQNQDETYDQDTSLIIDHGNVHVSA